MKKAYATTLTHGDAYAPGVEALGRSLRATGTREPMVLMVTADVPGPRAGPARGAGLDAARHRAGEEPDPAGQQLFPRFDKVSPSCAPGSSTPSTRWSCSTPTWWFTTIDELFERPELAAAPDFLRPDRFNSGAMVLDPSRDKLARMLRAARRGAHLRRRRPGVPQRLLRRLVHRPRRPPAAHLVQPPQLHLPVHARAPEPPRRGGARGEDHPLHGAEAWESASTVTGGSELWWSAYLGAHPSSTAGGSASCTPSRTARSTGPSRRSPAEGLGSRLRAPLGLSQIDLISPPSIRSVQPVIQRAPGDTRKAISSAISSGSP